MIDENDIEWRDIPKYEGHYQASNTGLIRSIKKNCMIILKGDIQKNGYKRVYLWLNGMQSKHLVHRLVAQTFIPNPLNLSDINHLDENKLNNHVDNLEWCSHSYNMNYGHIKEKISNSRRGKTLSDEHKQKLRIDTSNRKWINNGEINKYVYIWDLDIYLSDGWQLGRIIYWR